MNEAAFSPAVGWPTVEEFTLPLEALFSSEPVEHALIRVWLYQQVVSNISPKGYLVLWDLTSD